MVDISYTSNRSINALICCLFYTQAMVSWLLGGFGVPLLGPTVGGSTFDPKYFSLTAGSSTIAPLHQPLQRRTIPNINHCTVGIPFDQGSTIWFILYRGHGAMVSHRVNVRARRRAPQARSLRRLRQVKPLRQPASWRGTYVPPTRGRVSNKCVT